MKSRKRARQVTTLFHKYTSARDLALQRGETTKEWDEKLEELGGRQEYQKASQLSTSFHSTSKWVLGCLQRNGWLYGIPTDNKEADHSIPESNAAAQKSKRKRAIRRETQLLEIGAINAELLDAAERPVDDTGDNDDSNATKRYRLNVRAIDLHSMYPDRIEETDFLTLPLNSNTQKQFDVIVCSMVLNCVTSPEARGEMLAMVYHFLRHGGLLFLTIPRLCLSQSPYTNREQFLELLGPTGVGFQLEKTKDSPKVAFFICRRPETGSCARDPSNFNERWTKLKTLQKGKKYRNSFAVVLNQQSVRRDDLL
jgi:25S rRNA (adenine2142-N1)-methyltransferase